MGEKKKKKYLLYREFLNKPTYHSTATIFINLKEIEERIETVEKHLDKDKSHYESMPYMSGGQLHISDCSKEIFIDLDFNSMESYNNAIYKLQTMANCINSTLCKYKEYGPRVKDIDKRIKASPKKKKGKTTDLEKELDILTRDN